jgi:hypothetical protein
MLNLKAKWIENAIVVVLGAGDPEMSAIAAACAALGIRTLQAATADGIACRPGNAYTADRYVEGGVYTDDYVISVECAVVDLRVDFCCRPPQPWRPRVRPPSRGVLVGQSSIGQVLRPPAQEGGITSHRMLVDAFGPERLSGRGVRPLP